MLAGPDAAILSTMNYNPQRVGLGLLVVLVKVLCRCQRFMIRQLSEKRTVLICICLWLAMVGFMVAAPEPSCMILAPKTLS